MTGPTTQQSVHIDASPAAVAAVVADVEDYPSWSPELRDVRIVERDAEGRPSQVGFSVEAGAVEGSAVLRYVWDLTPEGCGTVAWSLVRSSVVRTLHGRYAIDADGDGTRVTYALELDTAVPVPGFVMRKIERSIVSRALDGLRERVER